MVGRPKKTAAGLGPLESEVMQVGWSAGGPVSVRNVLDALNDRRAKPLAYTTVMTVMNRLVAKHFLARRGEPRKYSYAPTADGPAAAATRDVIRTYGDAAIAQFVSEARADPRLLRRLHALLEDDA